MPTSPEPTPDSPLSALREIRRRLRLGALTKGEIEQEQWFVETHIARCERLDVRITMAEQLRAAYAENTDVSLLFYGHGGTGKSTELAKLSLHPLMVYLLTESAGSFSRVLRFRRSL